MASITVSAGMRRETDCPQFTRDVVLMRHQSQALDPKPVDLAVGKEKRNLCFVEACRGSTCKCSFNLWLGVKSQSRPAIAGSCRNRPQSSLD